MKFAYKCHKLLLLQQLPGKHDLKCSLCFIPVLSKHEYYMNTIGMLLICSMALMALKRIIINTGLGCIHIGIANV